MPTIIASVMDAIGNELLLYILHIIDYSLDLLKDLDAACARCSAMAVAMVHVGKALMLPLDKFLDERK